MTDIVKSECCDGCEKHSNECDECATNYYMSKLEDKVRADERRKFAEWLLHHSMLRGISMQDLSNNNSVSEQEIIEQVVIEYEIDQMLGKITIH